MDSVNTKNLEIDNINCSDQEDDIITDLSSLLSEKSSISIDNGFVECHSLNLDCFNEFVKNARVIAKNRIVFTRQHKLNFIENAFVEFKANISLIEKQKDLKTSQWLYSFHGGVKSRNKFLILQCDEQSEYYLFCIYCVCFGTNVSRGQLSDEGIRIENRQGLRKLVNYHVDSANHQKAEKEYNGIYEYETPNTDFERIEKNRFIVNEVIETIMQLITDNRGFIGNRTDTIGNQNLDSRYLHMKKNGQGSFHALLQFRAKVHRNPILLHYLSECQTIFKERPNCAKTTFISRNFIGRTLSKLSEYIKETVTNIIIKENNGKFGFMFDSTTDVSNQSMGSIVLRYSNDLLEVHQTTIGLTEFKDSSGTGIHTSIKRVLEAINLDTKRIISTSLDGAANLSSLQRGLVGLINRDSPNNQHFWCFSHRFNLIVKDSCDKYYSDLFNNLHSVATMFHFSNKRALEWRRILNRLNMQYPDIKINRRFRPVRINPIRWWAKQKALKNILSDEFHFLTLFIFLHNITNAKKFQAKKKIQLQKLNLFNYFQSEKTVISLFLLNHILSDLQRITNFLQASDLIIFEAIPKIEEAYAFLIDLVSNESYILSLVDAATSFFQKISTLIYSNEAKTLLIKNGNKKRVDTINIARINDSEKKLLVEKFQNFARELLINIQAKFITNDLSTRKIFYKEIMLFSPKSLLSNGVNYSEISLKMMSKYTNSDETRLLQQLEDVSHKFKQFLVTNIDNDYSYLSNNNYSYNGAITMGSSLSGDNSSLGSFDDDHTIDESNHFPEQYEIQCARNSDFKLLRKFLLENRNEKYKELFAVYKYILSLPVTQNKCESDFSKLKHIKSAYRSSIDNNKLEDVMIISLAKELLPDNVHPIIIDSIGNSSNKLRTQLIHQNK